MRSRVARSLSDHDYITLENRLTSQTNGLIFGDSGCGKSTFLLRYCPGPIAFINFDGRADDLVLEEQERGKKIYYTRIDFSEDIQGLSERQAKIVGEKVAGKFLHNFNVAIKWAEDGLVKTIGIDTGSELDEILSIRYKGNVGVIGNDYGASKGLINRQWLTLFRKARNTNANLIVLARAKEVWRDKKPTGIFEPVLSSKVSDAVDWKCMISVEATPNKVPVFVLRVSKAGTNINEIYKEYRSTDWGDVGPFAYVCKKMYPKRPIEDWCEVSDNDIWE